MGVRKFWGEWEFGDIGIVVRVGVGAGVVVVVVTVVVMVLGVEEAWMALLELAIIVVGMVFDGVVAVLFVVVL